MFDDILGDVIDIEQYESDEAPEWCPNCWCSDVLKTCILRQKEGKQKGHMERQWVCMRCSYEIWC
jgi:hypothetical protein